MPVSSGSEGSSSGGERRTVFYSGNVQGVGFRYTSQSVARQFAVAGYVRNLPDGRVELVAEGAPKELNAFLAEIQEALGDYIASARVERSESSGEYQGFVIRY